MRLVRTCHLAILTCVALTLSAPARADITLTVTKTGAPDQAQLDWTAGFPPYDVYREAVLADLVGLVNPPVATLPGRTYVSTDAGPLFHYLVSCATGTACMPPPESCTNGRDDDQDGATDCFDPDCVGDPSCGVCGNGIPEGAEQCDTGTSNSDTDQGACRTTCVLASCGDTVVDYVLGEECDDGGTVPGDRCDATCRIEATPACGDGALDIALGEECDDSGTAPGDGCSATCQLETVGATCGSPSLDAGERCEDGNVLNGDGCNPTCNLLNTTSLFAGSQGVSALLDGMGTAARFTGTATMTVDATAIWMAMGNVIRRIDVATADVVTIAGDATGNAAGNVDDPIGLNARFSGPGAITTDGATVWIADEGNRVLRAMSTTPPHAVTTVAGSGAQAHVDGVGTAASFDGIRGATYFNGFVYLVDPNAATLRRFDPVTGEVLTLAGTPYAAGTADGYGTAASFISPRYMTSDNSGNVHVADTNGATIRSYNTVTTWVGTLAGSGTQGYVDGIGTAALVHRPRGMTSDGTSIYWTEVNQHAIRQCVLATASVTTQVGQHCNGTMPCAGGYAEGIGVAAQLNLPFSLAFHFPSNSLFVYDSGNVVLRRIQ